MYGIFTYIRIPDVNVMTLTDFFDNR